MNLLLFVFLALVIVVGIVGLFILFALVSAKQKWQFTTIPKGNTVVVVKGEDLKAILPNVDGHKVSEEKDLEGRHWLVKVDVTGTPAQQKREMRQAFQKKLWTGTRHIQWFLWDKFGVRFVSWIYPQVRVKRVHISMNRLRQEAGVEPTSTLLERIEVDEGDIDSIRFIFPRPMVMEGVELAGDNSRINILVLMNWRLVIPSLPIFYYDGKFMPLLDAVIVAGIIDFCSHYRVPVTKNAEGIDIYNPKGKKKVLLTYALWLQLLKDKGSALHQHLLRLNASPEFYKSLKDAGKEELVDHLEALLGGKPQKLGGLGRLKERIPLGLINTYGLALADVNILAWEADETTKELAKAVQANEIQKRMADGIRAEAYGARDALIAKATGEASRYDQLVRALIDKGVTPDTAARVLETDLRTANIGGKDSKVRTYIEGGASASVIVQSEPESPEPTVPPTSSP